LTIHANVRSTTHLRGRTWKVLMPNGLRTISTVMWAIWAAHSTSLPATGPALTAEVEFEFGEGSHDRGHGSPGGCGCVDSFT
jgi:hypothetical protein